MRDGFTLIEVLIVIIISGFLVVGSLAVFSNFNDKKAFEVSTQGVVNLLKDAKSNTLASKDSTVYGVHFETSRAVFFKGSTFSDPDPFNRIYTMPADIELSSIIINGGGSDIVFDRLTGETQQFGTTTISRISDPSVTIDIVVGATGVVEY